MIAGTVLATDPAGGSTDEAADGYKQRCELHHFATGPGSCVLRAWSAKNAGLVWRLWFSRHHGILYAHGNARSRRLSDHLYRILRRAGADCRIADAHRRS